MQLKELLEKYLRYSRAEKSLGTYQFDNGMHKYWIKIFIYFKVEYIKDLEKIEWLDVVEYLRKNTTLKASSINKVTTYLGTVLNHFKIENPLGSRKKLASDTTSYEVPAIETMEKIYSYIFSLDNSKNNLTYKLIVALLRETGLRRNELLNLKFSDIDYDPNIIYVKITKNKKNRISSFSNNLTKPLLKEAYKKHGHISDYILWNYNLNIKADKETVNWTWEKIRKATGIKNISSHRIRKFFATDMYKKLDGDILTVQQFLGHQSPEQTKIYIGLDVNFLLTQYNKVIK